MDRRGFIKATLGLTVAALSPLPLLAKNKVVAKIPFNHVMRVIMEVAPRLQQQGIALDVNALLQRVAEYNNLPGLADVMRVPK